MLKILIQSLIFVLVFSVVASGLTYFYLSPYLRTQDVPGGPVISVTKIITGRVVESNGKTITIESGGKKVKISSFSNMQFTDPTPRLASPSAGQGSSTDSAKEGNIYYPTDFVYAAESVSDFAKVKVGKTITLKMLLSASGKFNVVSLGYEPEQ